MTQLTKQNRSSELGIWAMALGNFAAGMSSLIMAGVLSDMAADLEVTIGQAGQLVTIYSFVYALSAPFVMTLATRYDRRLMLLLGLLFIFSGSLVAALATSYTVLFVARIIAAIGSAFFVPLAAVVAIALASEEERGRVSAIVFTGFTLSTALGLPIGTYIGLNFGWRYSFGIVVVFAFVAAIFVRLMLPKGIETPPANLKVFRQVFRNGLLMTVLAVTILQFGGQMALFAFIGPWLQALTDLGATGITIVLVLTGVGGIVGNIFAGRSTDRIGARATQLIFVIMLAVVMATLNYSMQLSLVLGVFLLFVWGAVGQGFIPPQVVRIVGIDQELSGASLSLNSAFINFGVALGAFAGGIYVDNVGIETLSFLGVGGTLLALIVFGLSWLIENRSIPA